MVDGAEFWISCKWLKALRKASQWQLIKCSAPSTICWCQCDIRIGSLWFANDNDRIKRELFWTTFIKTGQEKFVDLDLMSINIER